MRLWQVAGADTVLVESYTYKAHEAGPDRSIGRLPDATGELVAVRRAQSRTPARSTRAGNGCTPTPGAANACGKTPAEPLDLGADEGAYR